jgi:uncharacterized membrane protein
MAGTHLILPYILTLIVFLAIDLLWLGVIAKKFYTNALSGLMANKPKWPAAILFYFLFIIGVFIFAILPGVDKGDLSHAAVLGALFGFFTYATYDLTNLALLKDWPIKITVVDILWGTFLTGLIASVGFTLVNWL